MLDKYTTRKYCKDFTKIENYEKAVVDTTQVWECHHRLETHNSDGEKRLVDLSSKELIALDMYYDRPPEELIFMTKADHRSLHWKGKCFSEEHKKKISEALKGKHPSEEARKKMSEAQKGNQKHKGHHASEEARKRRSEAHKGRPTWSKGKHLSEEHRKKISLTKKRKAFEKHVKVLNREGK